MRVLHVTDFYPPTLGGLERYVQSLATESVSAGLDVAVATQSHPQAAASGVEDGVRVFRIKSSSARVLKRAYVDPERPFLPPAPDPAVRRQLRAIIESWRPDIVQSHGWISFSTAARRVPPSTASLRERSISAEMYSGVSMAFCFRSP